MDSLLDQDTSDSEDPNTRVDCTKNQITFTRTKSRRKSKRDSKRDRSKDKRFSKKD